MTRATYRNSRQRSRRVRRAYGADYSETGEMLAILFGLVSVGAMLIGAALIDHGYFDRAPRFNAIVESSGESWIVDHDLTLEDCVALFAAHGVNLCERE